MGNTEIKEIIHDALRYPLSDWKKLLILGIITVFGTMAFTVKSSGITNHILIWFLLIVGFLIEILIYGYIFRIMKSSFAGLVKLPEFNSLFEMYIEGIKMVIVQIVYMIPVFLMIPGVLLHIGILNLIANLYMIIIIPILLMAITNMANGNDKLNAAFKLHEIFNKMGNIGWLNIIKWYITTGIIFLIIAFGITIIIIAMVKPISVALLIFYLIVAPYLEIYLYRSAALFYMSE